MTSKVISSRVCLLSSSPWFIQSSSWLKRIFILFTRNARTLLWQSNHRKVHPFSMPSPRVLLGENLTTNIKTSKYGWKTSVCTARIILILLEKWPISMMRWLRKHNSLSRQLRKYLNHKMEVPIPALDIFRKNPLPKGSSFFSFTKISCWEKFSRSWVRCSLTKSGRFWLQ